MTDNHSHRNETLNFHPSVASDKSNVWKPLPSIEQGFKLLEITIELFRHNLRKKCTTNNEMFTWIHTTRQSWRYVLLSLFSDCCRFRCLLHLFTDMTKDVPFFDFSTQKSSWSCFDRWVFAKTLKLLIFFFSLSLHYEDFIWISTSNHLFRSAKCFDRISISCRPKRIKKLWWISFFLSIK